MAYIWQYYRRITRNYNINGNNSDKTIIIIRID